MLGEGSVPEEVQTRHRFFPEDPGWSTQVRSNDSLAAHGLCTMHAPFV